MLTDRYGYQISTASAAARDTFVAGVDRLLSGNAGAIEDLGRSVAHDPDFALGHAALARAFQAYARGGEAQAAMRRARDAVAALTEREHSHVAALGHVVEGRSMAALDAARRHLAAWPRDAMVLQPVTGVFGLIGFSGRRGREAELHNLLAPLSAAYGDDWWFGSALAFAEIETGQIDRGRARVERALALQPRNANGAQ